MFQNILINRVTELRFRIYKKYCDDPKLRPPCSSQCGRASRSRFFCSIVRKKNTSSFFLYRCRTVIGR
jgi:hypothetical protein